MRELLPLLTVPEPVLFPGMITRLQVNRPQDVAAVEHHLASGRLLAVATELPAPGGDYAEPRFATAACTAKVLRSVRLGDGSVRVLIEGLARCTLSSPRPDPEAGALVTARRVREVVSDRARVDLLAAKLREELRAFIGDDPTRPPPLARLAELDLPPGRLADRVAANLTLAVEARLEYLAEPSVDRRLDRALVDLVRERELNRIDVEAHRKVQETMDRQQREYFLREKIRALQKELGESPERWDEAAELERKLREAGLPEAGLEEALRELERLRRMHPDAAEYTVTRTWLEWLASMPWNKLTEGEADIRRAAAVLDEDHFGLDKPKERILEYLAVRRLKPDGQGPVLCFLGPPGVGKTSLGRSIARALGRSFQRVSLGGVKDEAEIRGHRRTYVGALPGRIVHALKRAGTRNPVIVLDEIDKLGKDFRGDPASALLEVLDPEQNREFVDHYLDVPFDLSQVLFVCTANLADPIPAALHDRLEIIELPGYILEEKVQIARRHLLPRLRESHGLAEGQLTVTVPAVRHIIESYTQEAGVRNLERELAALHRKAARRFVEGRKRGMRVQTAEQVRALLGPPRHFTELAERMDRPGVAIGLAWTASGGDILFIEVTGYAGNGGGLKATGQLGGVMKESAEAALSLVRSRCEELGIDPGVFKDRSFHLHVPAGAIPKDGPSAGITMMVALASLLTGRRVRSCLAMTGEITLRGKVLPVGGIKEKVLAARRAGIREVVLPKRNETDLEDVPPQLRRDLVYHFVENVEDVLALAFEDGGPEAGCAS